jgi:lipoate-protein ligase A
MVQMDLFNLGHVPWLESQLIYHALPRLGMEGLILLAPAEPYVCIGYHQDAEQEVDLGFCQREGIPVFRREVGGGAVYLDGQQLFYQLVIHIDNPLAPKGKADFYQQFLEPVVQAYTELGVVDARFKPVNDVVTAEGRKISGNGAAEIGDYLVLVGNLIADFDYATMARVLLMPDEKFRDKVFKSMQENLTTLYRELGYVPSWDSMTRALVQSFGAVLGSLIPARLPDQVRQQVVELARSHTTREWLHKPGLRHRAGRRVKISEGVEVLQRVHKAPGGLIRGTLEVHGDTIVGLSLTGDFFFYPADELARLEGHLVGCVLDDVQDTIAAFYGDYGIESPGVSPSDLATVLAAEGQAR